MEILSPRDYAAAEPLFEPMIPLQPVCQAVLRAVYPGLIAVDDPAAPRAAFLFTDRIWCFLAGEPDAPGFIAALHTALFERRVVDPGSDTLLFTCADPVWHARLPEILSPRIPIAQARRHYTLEHPLGEGHVRLPAGYEIRPMTRESLEQTGLEIASAVQDKLATWERIRSPGFADYGMVTIHTPTRTVASWATVDYVCAGAGDVGLVTDPRHRRKGLATHTTAAAIDHGFASVGLTRFNWTVDAENGPSIRTAERLQFERQPDYVTHLFAFDATRHSAMLAYDWILHKRYGDAADLLERLISSTARVPTWAYLDAATAWARLHHADRALEHLNRAAKEGFSNVDSLLTSEAYATLHDHPDWETLVTRVRRNAAQSHG